MDTVCVCVCVWLCLSGAAATGRSALHSCVAETCARLVVQEKRTVAVHRAQFCLCTYFWLCFSSAGEVGVHWGDYETQKNCTTHFSAPLHIAFLERHAHSWAMWMPRAVKWIHTLLMCVQAVSVFGQYLARCHPWLERSSGSVAVSSLKHQCGRHFSFFTWNVSFVLPTAGGALTNRLPVRVNGEVLCLWEAEGVSSRCYTYCKDVVNVT